MGVASGAVGANVALVVMHQPRDDDEKLFIALGEWAMGRLANRSATLPRGPIGGDITQIDDDGIGLEAAWLELRDRIIPTAIPTDHPRYLSFIPGAPTVAAALAVRPGRTTRSSPRKLCKRGIRGKPEWLGGGAPRSQTSHRD
jgi:hypothetical protein